MKSTVPVALARVAVLPASAVAVEIRGVITPARVTAVDRAAFESAVAAV